LNTLGSRDQPAASNGALTDVPKPGDAFLLASDGLWECVTEPEMEEDFRASKNSRAWIGKMTARVNKRAMPDHDNYSAIAVKILRK
jgi:serine/threonine protein phosphatase PrpC